MKIWKLTSAELDKLLLRIFITACLLLAFMAGAVGTYFKYPPYNWLHHSDMAYHAMREKEEFVAKADHLPPITKSLDSELLVKPGATEGYTLYTTGNNAVLIDMKGNEVYKWSRPFTELWQNHPQVKNPTPNQKIFWYDAIAYPNGDLLLVSETDGGDTPHGYGMAKIDKNSKVLWLYDENAHHRMTVAQNGNIYALVQKFRPFPPLKGLKNPPEKLMDEGIAIASPDGKKIEQLYLFDLLNNPTYAHFFTDKENKRLGRDMWDTLHVNSAVPLEKDMAAAFPMFKPGQVLVSLRNISVIAMVDIQEKKVVWAKQGEWRFQHNAEFTADGKIMMFDNLGKSMKESRILSYDPKTDTSTTIYEGSKAEPFYTRWRGMFQQLPGGNLLVTESLKGRIFETTPDHTIVWQFKNPYTRGKKHLPIISARRFFDKDLPFLKDVKAP